MERQKQSMMAEMLKHSTVALYLKSISLPPAKNALVSKQFLKKASSLNLNRFPSHNKGMHWEYWRYCAQSLSAAPPNSEEHARSYAERSKLFQHVLNYWDSIIDVNRALAIGKDLPTRFRILLMRRKIECSVCANLGLEVETFYEAQSIISKMDDSDQEKVNLSHILVEVENYLKHCRSSHLYIAPAVFRRIVAPDISAVNTVYTEQYGKHLVAARDIGIGEIVCVEKAYASARSGKLKVYGICHHCLASVFTTVPCDTCEIANYCSLSCKAMALEKYHHIECRVLRIMHFVYKGVLNVNVGLALKMVIMGFTEAGSVEKLRAMVAEADMCKDNFPSTLTNGDFRSDSFKTFYSLPCQQMLNIEKHLCYENVIATICLASQTTMFGPDFDYRNVTDLVDNEDVVFIAALLLKMSEIASTNSKEYYSPSSFACIPDHRYHFVDHSHHLRGHSITTYSSFINHSCNPNVHILFSDDHKIIYYSILPITEGSEIFDSYTEPFYTILTKTQKRTYVKSYPLFECYCEGCVAERNSDERKEYKEIQHFVLNPKIYILNEIVGPLIESCRMSITAPLKNFTELESIRNLSAISIEFLINSVPYPSPAIVAFMYLLRISYECTLGPATISFNDAICKRLN